VRTRWYLPSTVKGCEIFTVSIEELRDAPSTAAGLGLLLTQVVGHVWPAVGMACPVKVSGACGAGAAMATAGNRGGTRPA
jgi:hypothetical protein